MGRQQLYLTKEEKLAANRLKSKRHYEKKAKLINSKRRKKYKQNKPPSVPTEKATTAEVTQTKIDTIEEKLAKRLNFYMFKAENIDRLLDEMTDKQPRQFAEAICLEFLNSHDKDKIHKHVVQLGKLQKRIVRCQDEILQLAGVGKEWNRLAEVAEDIRIITCWVEEIFCYAMVAYSEVEQMHRDSEFLYQSQN